MKILFDQGTPVPLRRHLHPHAVDTTAERGWSELENGDLLDQAEADAYHALITTDQNTSPWGSWIQPTLKAGGVFSAAYNGIAVLSTCDEIPPLPAVVGGQTAEKGRATAGRTPKRLASEPGPAQRTPRKRPER